MKNNPEKKSRRRFFELALAFVRRTIRDDIFALGAQCAYYLILTLVPALSLGLILTSGNPRIIDALLRVSNEILPAEAARIVEGFLNQTVAASTNTLFSFSALIAIYLLVRTVRAIMKALNKVYNVEETRSPLSILGRAVVVTVGIVPVMLLAMALIIFGRIITSAVWDMLGISLSFVPVWDVIRYLLTVLILFAFFTLIYRFLPNHRMHRHETYPGALAATGGWLGFSALFAWYVNSFSSFAVAYGSLAGIFILLSWFYLTSTIILLGGELNAFLADLRHQREAD